MDSEEAVNTILADAGWDDSVRDMVLRWCFTANRDLETPVWIERVTTGVNGLPRLIVENGYVEKPCNLVRVHEIKFYIDGACYRPYYQEFEANLNRLGWLPTTYNYATNEGYSYNIQVHETTEGFKVTNANGYEMVLVYGRYALDQHGMPWFDRDSLEALEAYCEMKALEMERRQMTNKVSFSATNEAAAQYSFHKRRYHGLLAERSYNQDELLQLYAHMNDPFRGTGNPWDALASQYGFAQIFNSYY